MRALGGDGHWFGRLLCLSENSRSAAGGDLMADALSSAAAINTQDCSYNRMLGGRGSIAPVTTLPHPVCPLPANRRSSLNSLRQHFTLLGCTSIVLLPLNCKVERLVLRILSSTSQNALKLLDRFFKHKWLNTNSTQLAVPYRRKTHSYQLTWIKLPPHS